MRKNMMKVSYKKNTFTINTVSDNTDPIFAARTCAMKYENINRSLFILQYDEYDA